MLNILKRKPKHALTSTWETLTTKQFIALAESQTAYQLGGMVEAQYIAESLAILSNWVVPYDRWLELTPAQVKEAFDTCPILCQPLPALWEGATGTYIGGYGIPRTTEQFEGTASLGYTMEGNYLIGKMGESKPIDLALSLVALWVQFKRENRADALEIETYLMEVEEWPAHLVLPAGFFLLRQLQTVGQS